jgi:hypothetical protein
VFVKVEREPYAYLLGLFLGDGCLTASRGSTQLLLTLDERYPALLDEAQAAVAHVVPHGRVTRYRREGCVVLRAGWKDWPTVLPQHGPGRKHTRPIVLEPWQRSITHEHAGAFVRGLFHSDGCRSINTVRATLPSGRAAVYEYARYFFTNRSEDILGLWAEHCAVLGVRTTRSSAKNMSVSHRASVAILERVCGPKR